MAMKLQQETHLVNKQLKCKQMKLRNILQVQPGRTHAAFPDFRKHLLEGLDVEKMAE